MLVYDPETPRSSLSLPHPSRAHNLSRVKRPEGLGFEIVLRYVYPDFSTEEYLLPRTLKSF